MPARVIPCTLLLLGFSAACGAKTDLGDTGSGRYGVGPRVGRAGDCRAELTRCGDSCVDLQTDPQHCGACAHACDSGPCAAGVCGNGPEGPSCAAGLDCGGLSCCQRNLVPGGAFPMGRSEGGSDQYRGGASYEQPEHRTTVSSFYLDRLEVTVGRFRAFLRAFDEGARPSVGAGANAAVESANALVPGTTGWHAEWDAELPRRGFGSTAGGDSLQDRLACGAPFATWMRAGSGVEAYPIGCVSWYEAFAFCIWDGGRLPTAAEWEYAAAGGKENRIYPWGGSSPNHALAVYGCRSDGSSGCTTADIPAAGSRPAGSGRWGHHDLAGSMCEWVLDWFSADQYDELQAGCTDCARLEPGSAREGRGGNWNHDSRSLRSAYRLSYSPDLHSALIGFRCARGVP